MEKFSLILALLLTFSSKSFGEPSKLWNATNVDKLKAELLSGYDRLTRPEDYAVITECGVGLTVIHMELDETKGVLETHAWMRLNWTDSKLKWDPKNYDDIKQLNVHPDEIWQPDVTVYNSAEANIVDHFAKTNKLIYPGGSVLWVPTAKFITYCEMDLKFWPFDEQHCIIKIGSWTFSAKQINLIPDKNSVDIEHYHSSEWKITSTSAERKENFYPCCPEPYVDITFHLNFRRQSPMFKAIAIVPAIVVVFMVLVAFWLPPQAGEKLLLNGIACITVCLLLMFLSQLLPIMSSTSPLIVTFYSHTLYLLSASFILSAIVINLARTEKSKAVSGIGRKILDGFLGKSLGGKQAVQPIKENQVEAPLVEYKSNDEHHNIHTPTETKAPLIQNEWIRLAITIDRTAFIIYLIIFILMGFYHFV